MNLNISNPFFLQNEITLKNDQLYIESTVLSRLLGIPYPKLVRVIKVVLAANRSARFKLIFKDRGHEWLSYSGFRSVTRQLLRRRPDLKNRVKRVNTQFMMKRLSSKTSRK